MAARRKENSAATGERFLATIYRIWMMRYIDVPEAIAGKLAKELRRPEIGGNHAAGKTKYIPVTATVNCKSIRTTLLPAGGGRYRMQFNGALRKAAGADTGEIVSVQLVLDRESREIAVPADLRAALKAHPKARKAFDHAPPGYRWQVLKWMDAAKSEAARARRIEIVMDRMLERALLGASKKRQE
jgi:hypothetical protein